MQTLNVKFNRGDYDIVIGQDIFLDISKKIQSQFHYKRLLIITDQTVSHLYLNAFMASFQSGDVVVSSFVVEDGESSKSFGVAEKLYSTLADEKFSRKDCIIALGGGVVGDLSGFVASTYMRGIDYIQIPTTLLSQVDSSVGGKVAINLPQGKNLVGSFYQPKAVYIDVTLLKTLPQREIQSGLAEVIKYGCIEDEGLFHLIEAHNLNNITEVYKEIVWRCLNIKIAIVQRDEKESHERMLLNFGHTIGHAIEKFHGFSAYSHGEAVAMGMYYILKAQMQIGEINPKDFLRLEHILKQYDLLKNISYEKSTLLPFILQDKKAEKDSIHMILLNRIGHGYIKTMDNEELNRFISEVML